MNTPLNICVNHLNIVRQTANEIDQWIASRGNQFTKVGWRAVRLSARLLRSERDLHERLAESPKMPSYFGRNWDALDEVLNDFYWIEEKQVCLVIGEACELLTEESTATLATFLSIVDKACRGGREWLARGSSSVDDPAAALTAIISLGEPNEACAVRYRDSGYPVGYPAAV